MRIAVLTLFLIISQLTGCAGLIRIVDTKSDEPYVVSESKKIGSDMVCTKVQDHYFVASQLDMSVLDECQRPRRILGGIVECIITPLALIDLPFSFVVDVIFVPYTFIKNHTYHSVYRDEDGNSCAIEKN